MVVGYATIIKVSNSGTGRSSDVFQLPSEYYYLSQRVENP